MFLIALFIGNDASFMILQAQPAQAETFHFPACNNAPCETVLDSMGSTAGWQILMGGGAVSASFSVVEGYQGQGLQLNYDLGNTEGAWVQLRRDFDPELNLSGGDHIRFFYTGNRKNSLQTGLVTAANEIYFSSKYHGSTHVPWWTYATWDSRAFQKDGKSIVDKSHIKAFFISVVNSEQSEGGAGFVILDELQYLNMAAREVPSAFETVSISPFVLKKASAWIASQQKPSGLVKSYQEEPANFAWLYDQALALLVFTQTNLPRATNLFNKLHALQNPDGSWYAGYDTVSGNAISLTKPVGANAWMVYAISRYAYVSNQKKAFDDAIQGGSWLATLQRLDGGMPAFQGGTGAPAEPNLNAWWAFRATGFHRAQADRLQNYILKIFWDPSLKRFISDPNVYKIFLDNQMLGAAFLKAIGRTQDVRNVLSYTEWTLGTVSTDGRTQGFDGAGPFSVWAEGTLQYIGMRGKGSQVLWNEMAGLQSASGGLLHSPDNIEAYITWHRDWHSISATAWFYLVGSNFIWQRESIPTLKDRLVSRRR
jgi:hypothetical protein